MLHPTLRRIATVLLLCALLAAGVSVPAYADDAPPPQEENQAEDSADNWFDATIEAFLDIILPDTGAKIEGDGSS